MGEVDLFLLKKSVICTVNLILIFSLFVGCSKDSIDENSTEKYDNDDKNIMDSWIGEYGFNEFAPPNQNMFYSISIDKNKNDYYADITIFGFQTNIRVRAKIVGDENFIKLLFNKYLPDNVYEPYEKGDVLLSFKKSNEEIYTYWGEIRPMITKNYKSGEIYFLKK